MRQLLRDAVSFTNETASLSNCLILCRTLVPEAVDTLLPLEICLGGGIGDVAELVIFHVRKRLLETGYLVIVEGHRLSLSIILFLFFEELHGGELALARDVTISRNPEREFFDLLGLSFHPSRRRLVFVQLDVEVKPEKLGLHAELGGHNRTIDVDDNFGRRRIRYDENACDVLRDTLVYGGVPCALYARGRGKVRIIALEGVDDSPYLVPDVVSRHRTPPYHVDYSFRCRAYYTAFGRQWSGASATIGMTQDGDNVIVSR